MYGPLALEAPPSTPLCANYVVVQVCRGTGQTILEVILNGYLSKEDVQRLARDRGLPTGRNKGELIDLLLSRYLDPAEPVEFLRVRALRDLCREFGLERTGDRDVLTNRILAAIREETPQWSRRPVPLPTAPSDDDEDETTETLPVRSESAGPWAVASILTTVLAAGLYAVVASEHGLAWGVVASILVAAVIAVALLRTHHWWHPRLAAFMDRPAE